MVKFFALAHSSPSTNDPSRAFLIDDAWDDWFTWATSYQLYYVDAASKAHHIGTVKIARFNMSERRIDLKESFDALPDDCFSLGQTELYYERLNDLGEGIREKILTGLNDIARTEALFSRALKERVTHRSLLRYITATTVRGQFRRQANGGARLSRYEFEFRSRSGKDQPGPVRLLFNVEPESNPPTNIHVIIGRNGVGKTHLLNSMMDSLLEPDTSKYGKFHAGIISASEQLFSNLVWVTFSAFDESEPLPDRAGSQGRIQYSYIGLKRPKKAGESNQGSKSTIILTNEFAKSVIACRAQTRIVRWARALRMLETDPIFKDSEIASIAAEGSDENVEQLARETFKKLSSGHKIVLLTITRLVETVEERTLILMDEPEGHLHPPLLSAFIRALSDLLINRNGVAVIATHSPVVLQEVPRKCVWKLRRSGKQLTAERLEIESFGENVGSLTREVFGLEVTHSGFHEIINQAIERNNDFDSIFTEFNGELGMEAQAIVRSLLYNKNLPSEDATNP